jgi:hypothetical protein
VEQQGVCHGNTSRHVTSCRFLLFLPVPATWGRSPLAPLVRKDENALEPIEKLVNCFLFLYLKYENESENGKIRDERKLMKY